MGVLGKTSSDDEAPVVELEGVLNTSSLPLLPGLLWPGMVVASVSVPFMDQIELFKNYLYFLGLCKKTNKQKKPTSLKTTIQKMKTQNQFPNLLA